MVGAHTDSPVLQLKPISKMPAQAGTIQLAVAPYGGLLAHTWFDRDLSIAGRAVVRRGNTADPATPFGSLSHELVHLRGPVARIPNLAIHLTKDRENFAPNKQKHLIPILSLAPLSATPSTTGAASPRADPLEAASVPHPAVLLRALAAQLGCDPQSIVGLDLNLVDSQPACIGGLAQEFIFSPRLDNLMSCFCALQGLIQAQSSLSEDDGVRIIVFFDHEEVGSQSHPGAASSLVESLLRRVVDGYNSPGAASPPREQLYHQSVQKSFLLSADMAHAVHPNYADIHDPGHKPMMGGGPVIKTNGNMRYATNAITAVFVRELARRNNIPVQEFCVQNDSPCGTTIGPIVAAGASLPTVDIGMPQLSMHSIREQAAVDDVAHYTALFRSFFAQYSVLQKAVQRGD